METKGARTITDGGRGLESIMTGSEREAGLQEGQIEIAPESLEEAETARDTVEEITIGAEVETDVMAPKVCTLHRLNCPA